MAVNNHKIPDFYMGEYNNIVSALDKVEGNLKKAAYAFVTKDAEGNAVNQLAFIEANKTIHLIEGSQDVYTKEEIQQILGDLFNPETGEIIDVSTYVTEVTNVTLQDANKYTDDKIAVKVYDSEGDL